MLRERLTFLNGTVLRNNGILTSAALTWALWEARIVVLNKMDMSSECIGVVCSIRSGANAARRPVIAFLSGKYSDLLPRKSNAHELNSVMIQGTKLCRNRQMRRPHFMFRRV